MSKREATSFNTAAGYIGDPRVFKFAITCKVCEVSFHTLRAARRHFTDQCLQKLAPRIWCGCCGRTFRNWGRCASHLNVKNAHFREPIRTIEISSTSGSEAESAPVASRSSLPRRTSTATRQLRHRLRLQCHNPWRQSPASPLTLCHHLLSRSQPISRRYRPATLTW